jgi:hypothetical protein
MLKGMRAGTFMVCAGFICCASADPAQRPAAEGDKATQRQNSAAQPPVQVEMPMNMDEPMQGGMMKKGMMKSDVKKSAEKHDEKLKERLEKEEESIPPMPARPSQHQ